MHEVASQGTKQNLCTAY